MKPGLIPSEAQEQTALVSHLRLALGRDWKVAAIPNGGSRNVLEAVNLKRQGVLPGIPDLVLLGPAGTTIWIEMKSKTGKLSAEQGAMNAWMVDQGHICLVCYGRDDAISQLQKMRVLKCR